MVRIRLNARSWGSADIPQVENKSGSLLPNLLPNAVGLAGIETDRER